MKLKTKAKSFYKRNKMLSIGLIAAGTWYVLNQRGMAPSLAPAMTTRSTTPVARYAYDSYAPVRNQPYYNTSHFFGPADGDPVFYGF